MPTYKNNGSTIACIGSVNINPGDTKVTPIYAESSYLDLEIVSHEPRSRTPENVYGDVLPSGSLDNLSDYSAIQIYNKSGDDISIVFNEDSENNAVIYPDGIWLPIELQDDVWSVSITGSGTGNVYVWGIPKTLRVTQMAPP